MEKKTKLTLTGKRPNRIIANPTEEELKEAVMVFGRFNPPTIAHQRLVEYAESLGGDLHVFLSKTECNERNPISYDRKFELCSEAFGEDNVIDTEATNPIEALSYLSKFYEKVTIVCGGDRIDEYHERFLPYNGILYEFDEISLVEFGNRLDEYDEGISSSLLREGLASDHDVIELLPEALQSEEILEELRDIVSLTEINRADYTMTKTTSPEGKPIWRKQRRRISKDKKDQDWDMGRGKSYRVERKYKEFQIRDDDGTSGE